MLIGTAVAILLGVVGFCAGFFGPMVLNPSANQGPLVGIFITGPGGAIVGGVLGAILGAGGISGPTEILLNFLDLQVLNAAAAAHAALLK